MSEQYGGQWSSPSGGDSQGGPPAYGAPQPAPPGYGGAHTQYGPPPQPGYGPPAQPGYGQPPAPGYPQQPYGSGYPMLTGPPLRGDYAPWGKRVLAFLIDGILGVVGLLVFYVGYFQFILSTVTAGGSTPNLSAGLIPMIIGGVISLLGFGWQIYNRWFVAGRTGQSLGKRVTKIRLISDETNNPIGPLNAFLRDLVHTLDSFAYVGYLWPLWDEKRQTFADKLMKTIVIDAPAQLANPAAAQG
jgi:uncharacterized RDD family membrane protein YckC